MLDNALSRVIIPLVLDNNALLGLSGDLVELDQTFQDWNTATFFDGLKFSFLTHGCGCQNI